MYENVSDILVARAQTLDRIGRPVAVSLSVHVVLIVLAAVLPATWFAARTPPKYMTITLGAGSTGPTRSGMTGTSGRRVDQVVPPKPHDLVLPTPPPKAPAPSIEPVKAPPAKPAAAAPPSPVLPTNKPSTGAQIQKGTAIVETGAKGLAVGLSSGGAGGTALDSNFCCNDYIEEMKSQIFGVWNQNQGAAGEVIVEFTIERNGSIVNIHTTKPSPNPLLNLASERAIQLIADKLRPLPDKFTGQRLIVNLSFQYQ